MYRKTEHEASPEFINYFRTLIGTITFFAIALILGLIPSIFLLSWDIWLILIVSFVFGQVLGDTAYFIAQRNLGTTKALAVSMTFPFFTFILSLIFLNKPFEIQLVFALLLIGVGIVTIGKFKVQPKENNIDSEKNEEILSDTNIITPERNQFVFVFFGLLASLGWAVGIVMVEYAFIEVEKIIQSGNLTSIVGNVIRFPVALLILLGMVFRQNFRNKKKNPGENTKKSRNTWMWLTVASIIGTSLGAFLYTEAIRLAGSTTMSLIASACPLFALPLTYAINREGISKLGFIGVLLTIVGVIIVVL